LLHELKSLGLHDDLRTRIAELIARRNRLVHGFLEDVDVIQAVQNGSTAPLVDQVDTLALDCQRLVNELTPSAFGGLEHIFGAPLERIVDALLSIDPEALTDDRLRSQLAMLHGADIEELRSALRADPTTTACKTALTAEDS
jgi:hypothetical protein